MKPPRTTDEVRLPGATLHCSCGADFSLPAVGGGRTSREGIEAVCPAVPRVPTVRGLRLPNTVLTRPQVPRGPAVLHQSLRHPGSSVSIRRPEYAPHVRLAASLMSGSPRVCGPEIPVLPI